MLAYTAGDTDVPLLEETIGDNFERIVATLPLQDALIEAAAVPGEEARRWSYTKLNDDVDRVARALLALGVAKGERIGIWSPNCAEWTILQYATAKVGAVLVNVRPAYRSHELEFVVKQNGMRTLVASAVGPKQRLHRHGPAGPGRMPRAARTRVPARRGPARPHSRRPKRQRSRLGGADQAGRRRRPFRAEGAHGRTGPARRDQHAVHLRHHGLSQGRHALPPQHPEQRLLDRRAQKFTEHDRVCCRCRSTTASASCSASWPRSPTAAPPSFGPRLQSRRGAGSRAGGGTALYGVPTMFIAQLQIPCFRLLRSLDAAHGHHGRQPLPHRGDAPGDRRDGRQRGDDRLRADRGLAGVHADPARRRCRARVETVGRTSRT